jgi:F-type H+-transporting ATPase subunit gamma
MASRGPTMATREVLQRRVESTETLQSVVQTMKALATVRIGQVRHAVGSLDKAHATLEFAFQVLMQREPDLADAREPEHRAGAWAAVVFGSDHGLAGPFNERIARHAADHFADLGGPGEPHPILGAGRRLQPRLRLLGYPVERVVRLPGTMDATEQSVTEVVTQIEAWQRDRGVERVFVIHHQPTSGTGYRPRTVQLLPLDGAWLRELRDRPWPSRRVPMLGLDGPELLQGLVRQYLAHVLVRVFAASQAAENAARLAAMEAAERNIDDRLTQLRHAANLERQTAVTEELLDVQAGFAAAGGMDEGAI